MAGVAIQAMSDEGTGKTWKNGKSENGTVERGIGQTEVRSRG